MKTNYSGILFFMILTGFFLTSCQKELDGLINGGVITPVNQKPRVGTTWYYRYYVYFPNGNVYTTGTVTHKAKSEETINGEKWLRIVDVATDTLAYLLNEKTGGLYQYTNSDSYLLCKYPAVLNDTYSTFNEGSTENFIVKGVNDTLPTGIGDVPVNYYEGFKGPQIIDLIWYNEYAWIVRKSQYRTRTLALPFFYKHYTYFLDDIVY
ncbi:MAG: hypothetical protein IPH68_02645 [Chitinophagaceae bacterium]|nr:hypothetical protein [Chitinophagaceae bacterium]MBK7559296.1 hypothetical protein [Chitinophagaceae bacterium]MBK9532074.1 hypothetical protein [Chitinophagaceae bacterium]HQW92697.1 hypothetical protein [Ferruginibacter sp.]